MALLNFVYWNTNSLRLSAPSWALWPARMELYLLVTVPSESGAASALAPYLSVFF